jgi:hypothetical protein
MLSPSPYSISRRHFLYASGLTLASSALSAKKIVGANDSSKFPVVPAQSHPSESVMHLSNACYHMSDLQSSSELKATIAGHDDLLQIVDAQNEQLAAWGIKDPQYYCGPAIKVNPETREISTPGVGPELIGPNYRKGYEVPKLV